ncbi:MAG: hypothetical protein JO117_11060 [Verrucomicrobia bacterium]|nr:hypothetical protein [Verrucomicrobiota bacterium]
MASGVVALAAGAGVALAQVLLRQRRGTRELLALGVQTAILVVLALDISVIHTDLKAHSVGQFFHAFFSAMGWPLSFQPFVASVIVYAPTALIAVQTARAWPPKENCIWFALGMQVWTILQIASVAYGRADYPLASKYLDVFIIGVVMNIFFILIPSPKNKLHPPSLCAVATSLWLMLIFVAAGDQAMFRLPADIAENYRQNTAQSENLSKYLSTNDISILANAPYLEIPYPSAHRLSEIVSMPEVRAILPPSLIGGAESNAGTATGLRRLLAASIRHFKTFCLTVGPLLIPIGLALFVILGLRLSLSSRHSNGGR